MSMRPGMIVEIHSLQTAIALNGELGELGVYSVAAERWQVQLLTRSSNDRKNISLGESRNKDDGRKRRPTIFTWFEMRMS